MMGAVDGRGGQQRNADLRARSTSTGKADFRIIFAIHAESPTHTPLTRQKWCEPDGCNTGDGRSSATAVTNACRIEETHLLLPDFTEMRVPPKSKENNGYIPVINTRDLLVKTTRGCPLPRDRPPAVHVNKGKQ